MSHYGHWPPAELTWFPRNTPYGRLWGKSGGWKPFMWVTGYGVFPNSPGQDRAAADTAARPAVYEFGISHCLNSSKIYKVYVGMSRNVRDRHMTYARNGSHIPHFLTAAMQEGNIIWRRIVYMDSEMRAQQVEMQCQSMLDYPWNKDQNPRGTRFVYLRKQSALLGLLTTKELVVRNASTGQTRVHKL